MTQLKFDFQILDEAQYIKNHTTAASKAVKVIHSKTRLALTGTPIENRLSELWSIFDYLMPGFLYKYETFKKSFETPIVKNKDMAASERLRQMTAPFILRRLKKTFSGIFRKNWKKYATQNRRKAAGSVQRPAGAYAETAEKPERRRF